MGDLVLGGSLNTPFWPICIGTTVVTVVNPVIISFSWWLGKLMIHIKTSVFEGRKFWIQRVERGHKSPTVISSPQSLNISVDANPRLPNWVFHSPEINDAVAQGQLKTSDQCWIETSATRFLWHWTGWVRGSAKLNRRTASRNGFHQGSSWAQLWKELQCGSPTRKFAFRML